MLLLPLQDNSNCYLVISDKGRDVNHNRFRLLSTSYMPDSALGTLRTFNPLNKLHIIAEETVTQSSPKNRNSEYTERHQSEVCLTRVTEGWHLFLTWKGGTVQTCWFGGLLSWSSPACYGRNKQNQTKQYLPCFSSPGFRTPSVLYIQCSISESC